MFNWKVSFFLIRCDQLSTYLYFIEFLKYIRQQTTTNDYCRLQTFVQRLFLDRVCIFAAETHHELL